MPSPSILIAGFGFKVKIRNTLIMTSAADVMTRADRARPIATDSRLSPVTAYSSRIRVSRSSS